MRQPLERKELPVRQGQQERQRKVLQEPPVHQERKVLPVLQVQPGQQEHSGHLAQQQRHQRHQRPRHPRRQRHQQRLRLPSSSWPLQPCASFPRQPSSWLLPRPCARLPREPASPRQPSRAPVLPGTPETSVQAARRRPGRTRGTSGRYPGPGCGLPCSRSQTDGCSHRRSSSSYRTGSRWRWRPSRWPEPRPYGSG